MADGIWATSPHHSTLNRQCLSSLLPFWSLSSSHAFISSGCQGLPVHPIYVHHNTSSVGSGFELRSHPALFILWCSLSHQLLFPSLTQSLSLSFSLNPAPPPDLLKSIVFLLALCALTDPPFALLHTQQCSYTTEFRVTAGSSSRWKGQPDTRVSDSGSRKPVSSLTTRAVSTGLPFEELVYSFPFLSPFLCPLLRYC